MILLWDSFVLLLFKDWQIINSHPVEEYAKGQKRKGDRELTDRWEIVEFRAHIHTDQKDIEPVQDHAADNR